MDSRAQWDRILRSSRRRANPKHRCNSLNPVSKPEQLAFNRRRNIVLSRSGRVLRIDGPCNPLAQSLRPRVQTADHSLQLGKLFHQLRRQIGLRQQRCLVKCDLIEGNLRQLQYLGKLPYNPPILSGLPEIAPQLLLESRSEEHTSELQSLRH